MTTQTLNPLQDFQWTPQPQAARFIGALVETFLSECPAAAELAQRMRDLTGTRFYDWVDYIALNRRDGRLGELKHIGYAPVEDLKTTIIFTHDGGIFPTIIGWDHGQMELGIKMEATADFAASNSIQTPIEGAPLNRFRRLAVSDRPEARLVAVERHGYRGVNVPEADPAKGIAQLQHLEKFRSRQRDFDDDAEGFEHANTLIDGAIADLGVDLTCDLWFATEREYWQRRNRAAQVQYARQQKLGLGWANHDHHTYRCARKNFHLLVATWEKLGFHCRERFYAGREAGWGAQVMEQPITGITTFNDVDLSPDELMGDFAHDGLSDSHHLGTVGLWCGLHGESFLKAGMHHLEAQFDFDALVKQLAHDEGIKTMKPFTNFPYLRQAFTEGERWDVNPKRIEKLLRAGSITESQAKQFRDQGAIGSHLENLERNDGFKGFNQSGVSEIISATDPRKHVRAGA